MLVCCDNMDLSRPVTRGLTIITPESLVKMTSLTTVLIYKHIQQIESIRGAYNRLIITYPYALKNQRKTRNAPSRLPLNINFPNFT